MARTRQACAPEEPPPERACIERMEAVHKAWLEAHETVPGMRVESSPELAWMRGPGVTWSNAAVRVRLEDAQVERRLAEVFTQACVDGRGFGVWVSDLATPSDLSVRLRALGFRKRKRFPAMLADLDREPARSLADDLSVETSIDHAIFERCAHPYFGKIATPISRFELARLAHLNALRPRRVFDVVLSRREVPIASATILIDGDTSAFWDVGVLPSERNKGVGTALMQEGLAFAREHGARAALLLSSGMGYGLYLRAGFREVGRIAYWYSAGRRN